MSILWRRQSRMAAIISPLLGMATGIAVWIGSAHALYGELTVANTGMVSMLAVPTAGGSSCLSYLNL